MLLGLLVTAICSILLTSQKSLYIRSTVNAFVPLSTEGEAGADDVEALSGGLLSRWRYHYRGLPIVSHRHFDS